MTPSPDIAAIRQAIERAALIVRCLDDLPKNRKALTPDHAQTLATLDAATSSTNAFDMVRAVAFLQSALSASQAEAVALREGLKECADDLESELNARYPASVRAYPAMDKDFHRDMSPVYTARKLLESPLSSTLAAKAEKTQKVVEAARKENLETVRFAEGECAIHGPKHKGWRYHATPAVQQLHDALVELDSLTPQQGEREP